MPELGRILTALGVPCAVRHSRGKEGASGPHLSPDDEVAAAKDAMRQLRHAMHAAPKSAVLLNYHMGVAGHRPFGGHFSPLVAYHEKSERFLVLDCWPDTEPCWHSAARLWSAIAGTDGESRLSRGWLVAGGGVGEK